MTRCIEKLAPIDGGYSLELDGGHAVSARAVLLATGVEWRRLEVEGADRLLGRGVLYGASRPEANNVNGKKVFIVGGGNSAGQAAMFFSNYAAEVKVLVRGEGLKLSMSQYLIGEIASKANIEVVPFTEVVAVEGEEHLQRIVTRVRPPGGKEKFVTYEADALFVMIGADANTTWLPAELEREPKGYICTGRDLTTWKRARAHFPWRPACPEFSVPATCAIIPSSAYPAESARVAWQSRLFTSTWRWKRTQPRDEVLSSIVREASTRLEERPLREWRRSAEKSALRL